MTALDKAHEEMQSEGGGDAARLRFYEQLADAELFVLLEKDASGEVISPELFDVEDGRFVLAFDQEDRLSAFAERVAPFAAVSGRVLAKMLNEQGVGLGLNLGVAPSSILIPAAAMDWLNQTLDRAPDQVNMRIAGVETPVGLGAGVTGAIEAKLVNAAGLALAAYLVAVRYSGGERGHLLGFVGADRRAQKALAKAADEALTFAGSDTGTIDVGFFTPDDPIAKDLARHGIPVDLPEPQTPEPQTRAAPGSDPEKPPILR